jgi:hypothetical protein
MGRFPVKVITRTVAARAMRADPKLAARLEDLIAIQTVFKSRAATTQTARPSRVNGLG